jgi:hypothetical protein
MSLGRSKAGLGHQLPVYLASQISMKQTFWKPSEIGSLAVGGRYERLAVF